jgi:hypothetical protein
MGNMRFPAAMMILSAFVQVPLSGLLITGAFGAPKLGVMGAAVSAVISSILLAAVMLIRLAGDSGQIRLTKPAAVFRRHHFADILQVALPASVTDRCNDHYSDRDCGPIWRAGPSGLWHRIENRILADPAGLWHWRVYDLVGRCGHRCRRHKKS